MRTLALSLVVAVASGCAPTIKSTPPTSASGAASSPDIAPAMAEAQAMSMLMRQAQAEAERACAPLLDRQTSWDEERAVGTMLAVRFAGRSGHFYLDGATEKDPDKLIADLASRKPLTLPEGGKNAVSAHVAVVGRNLARFSARPDLPWVFGVIENDAPDAFSEPGGYVFVTTGLLKKMKNEAQLAGVLAHEIGHVVHKHALTRYRETRHKQCVAAKFAAYAIEHGGPKSPATDQVARFARSFDGSFDVDAADGNFTAFIVDALMMMMQGNDKEAELLTDRTALELVSFAGYDAAEYEQFLLANAQPLHPAGADRAAKLAELRAGELKDFVHGTAKPDLAKVFAPLAP